MSALLTLGLADNAKIDGIIAIFIVFEYDSVVVLAIAYVNGISASSVNIGCVGAPRYMMKAIIA